MTDLFDDRFLAALSGGQVLQGSATSGDDHIVGTSGADSIQALAGDDTVLGLGGDDTIDGGAGDDSLDGGKGDDLVLDTGGGNDSLFGGLGDDQLKVDHEFVAVPATVDHILLDGGAGADNLGVTGGSIMGGVYQNDVTLLGGAGDDLIWLDSVQKMLIDAGDGNDTLDLEIGGQATVTLGAGADLLRLTGRTGDTAMVITDFQAGAGGDRIELRDAMQGLFTGSDGSNPFGDGHLRIVQQGADAILQADADGGGDSWADFIVFQNVQAGDLTAFNLDDFLIDGSDPAGVVIVGTAGTDWLNAGLGADTIKGLGGDDYLTGGSSANLLIGGAGNDFLVGNGGADTMIGGSGNDAIFGGGRDMIDGGVGDDTVGASYHADETGVATLDAGHGDDTIYVGFSSAPDAGAVVSGGAGDDIFNISGAGRLVADGGAGGDTFNLSDVGVQSVLTLGDGRDVVRLEPGAADAMTVTITDFAAGPGGDRLDLLDFLNAGLVGWDHSANPFAAGFLRLLSDGGDTRIQVSALGDAHWSDLFVLEGVSASSLTAENLGGYPGDGSDPVGQHLKGGAAGDTITGSIGPDTINGAGGGDLLVGGAGDDSLAGGAGNDTLDGGYGADVLNGGGGDDQLRSYDGGADTLLGGAGNDELTVYRFYSDFVDAGLVLNGGAGDDSLECDGSDGAIVSAKISGGSGADTIGVYNVAAATISGGDGDDMISLGLSHYAINAGKGDDIVLVQGGGQGIRVALGAGADEIRLASYVTAGRAVEVIDFSSEDKIGLASLVATQLNRSGGDPFGKEFLRLAQIGADTVLQIAIDGGGTSWADLIRLDGVKATSLTNAMLDGFNPGPAWLVGGAGRDVLTAGDGFTHLDGAGGDDVLRGSAGVDVLVGGSGADTLTGKGGADEFRFDAVSDSTAAAHDLITDLTDADVIDLSRVDANTAFSGDQAFVLVAKLDGHSNELALSYDSGSNTTTLAGDVDGDGVADLVVLIAGDHTGFTNFVL